MTRNIEYVLWGLPADSNDPIDEKVLSTQARTPGEMDTVKQTAARDGWHAFRVQVLDLDTKPDFTGRVIHRPADSHPQPQPLTAHQMRNIGLGAPPDAPLAYVVEFSHEHFIGHTKMHLTAHSEAEARDLAAAARPGMAIASVTLL